MTDPITLADEAEERSAAEALRACQNTRDLGVVFTRDCDHFDGPAYDRLYAVFMDCFRRLAPMSRAG